MITERERKEWGGGEPGPVCGPSRRPHSAWQREQPELNNALGQYAGVTELGD